MYETLLPVLVLLPRHLQYVNKQIVGIKVNFLDISEAKLLFRLSAMQPVKETNRPLSYRCTYNNQTYKAVFFHDCMVIQ